MKIKNVPLHEIKPYDNNPRVHSVKQLEAIANSIQRFGFRGTILLDKNNYIVAGHARYEAAATLGMSELPCEYCEDLSEEDINAYRIIDNKIAAMSYDDSEKLFAELAKLPDYDFKPFNIDLKPVEIDIKPIDDNGNSSREEKYIVSVFCNNESEQQSIFNEIKERGFECTYSK